MTSRSRMSAPPEGRALAFAAARLVTDTLQQVFGTVVQIHDKAIELHRAARARDEQMGAGDVDAIREHVLDLLARHGEIAVGMGMVMAPELVAGPRLRLEWWQQDSVRDVPARLDVDLNPASVDFYDYLSAEWFSVPRTTGRRHIVGPYVDVHGTGRYVLTLTMPVTDEGEFLGVVGADVPAARLETHVLRQLGATAADVVVVNTERRVVLSSSPHWLTGALIDLGHMPAADLPEAFDVAGVSWHLFTVHA